MKEKKPLLKVENLCQHFKVDNRLLKAVDDVSFNVYPGETLGLVGESGCGKSTVAKSILRLFQPTSGKIFFNGEEISSIKEKKLIPIRRDMQIIFQDSFASLNPRMTVEEIIQEPLIIHKKQMSRFDQLLHVKKMLKKVGLLPHYGSFFPHELSGGQRQRVCIAKALCLEPKFIVCDESIAALDVSIQSQIVNLIKDLQKDLGLTFLFISHDLSMVKYLCDRIAVMYLGKIVEIAPTAQLCSHPIHPYTKALLSSVPIPDPEKKIGFNKIEGELPSPLSPPMGCHFHPRCSLATPLCRRKTPELETVDNFQKVRCFEKYH